MFDYLYLRLIFCNWVCTIYLSKEGVARSPSPFKLFYATLPKNRKRTPPPLHPTELSDHLKLLFDWPKSSPWPPLPSPTPLVLLPVWLKKKFFYGFHDKIKQVFIRLGEFSIINMCHRVIGPTPSRPIYKIRNYILLKLFKIKTQTPQTKKSSRFIWVVWAQKNIFI